MARSKGETGRGEQDDGRQGRDTLQDEQAPSLDLSRTLPTGAAFSSTWNMPAFRPSTGPAAEPSNQSGVRRLDGSATPHTGAPPAPGLGQTLISMVPGAAMPQHEIAGIPPDAPVPHDALGRTLRMEIGLTPSTAPAAAALFQYNEPRDTLEPQPPAEALSPTRRAAFSGSHETVLAASVQRVGDAPAVDTTSTRPSAMRHTDPFGLPVTGRPGPVSPPRATPTESAQPTTGQGGPAGQPATPAASDRPSSPRSARARADARAAETAREYLRQQPGVAGHQRPGPRTLVGAGLVGVFVAALGLLFAKTGPTTDETVVAPATETAPHVVTPASSAAKLTDAPALTTTTEISSVPAAAEVVLGGAVVANTPARIARPNFETDYLVRLAGYDSQLIRIGPSSPAQITVRLTLVVPSGAPDVTREVTPNSKP